KDVSITDKAKLQLECMKVWSSLFKNTSEFEELESELRASFLSIRGITASSSEEERLAEVENYLKSVGLKIDEALSLRRYFFGEGPEPQLIWDAEDPATAEYFDWEIPLLISAGILDP